MTLGLSKGKKTNKSSFNTLTVLTQPPSLQWKTTRRMGPSPSWTPLSNQRLMVSYLSLHIESPPTQTSIYSGIATITYLSAKYSVINTLTHRAKMVCYKPELLQKEMEFLRKVLTHCKYPKWALDRVEKRLTKLSSEVSNGTDSQGTTGAQPTKMKLKIKVI